MSIPTMKEHGVGNNLGLKCRFCDKDDKLNVVCDEHVGMLVDHLTTAEPNQRSCHPSTETAAPHELDEGDILPCPFCGNNPDVEITGFHGGGRIIKCTDHDCMGPHTTAGTVADAVIQWNKRTPSSGLMPDRSQADASDAGSVNHPLPQGQDDAAGKVDVASERMWHDALAERVEQLRSAGCRTLKIDTVLGLIAFVRDGEGAAPAPSPAGTQLERRPAAFLAWAREMFGPVALVRGERLLRFVEEAIELAHADGMERATLNAVADRVYSREPGNILKEIGQAQACLETYAENINLSSDELAEREWQRVQSIPRDEWERRHSAKQAIGIALPATNGEAAS